jgi:hypothetical protein
VHPVDMQGTRVDVAHGDHAHAFDMAGRGHPMPPSIKLRCGACRKLIREVSVNHEGGVFVLGGVSPEGRPGELRADGGRTQGVTTTVNGKSRTILRAADCFDASPGGWDSSRRPTHYRFVCRHRNPEVGTLQRHMKATSLMALYVEAICAGESEVWLEQEY